MNLIKAFLPLIEVAKLLSVISTAPPALAEATIADKATRLNSLLMVVPECQKNDG
jgi:hypothetical protein